MSDIDQAFKEFLSKHNLDNTPGRRSAFEVIYPVYKKASVIESELAKQKLINQKLREACEFYGNIENWRNPKHPKKSDFNTLDSEEGRDVDAIRGGFFVCGKRARQALKEVDVIERGVCE